MINAKIDSTARHARQHYFCLARSSLAASSVLALSFSLPLFFSAFRSARYNFFVCFWSVSVCLYVCPSYLTPLGRSLFSFVFCLFSGFILFGCFILSRAPLSASHHSPLFNRPRSALHGVFLVWFCHLSLSPCGLVSLSLIRSLARSLALSFLTCYDM